jgi:hypothetical protein
MTVGTSTSETATTSEPKQKHAGLKNWRNMCLIQSTAVLDSVQLAVRLIISTVERAYLTDPRRRESNTPAHHLRTPVWYRSAEILA